MDEAAKKIALRKMPHGVYVVGVKQDEHVNGFTGTWMTQVSFVPPLVAIAVRKDSLSYAMITTGKVFSVNMLGTDQQAIAEHFVQPAKGLTDVKLEGISYAPGTTGAPVLDDAIAFIECTVCEVANEGGDHAVVIGEVIEAGVRKDENILTLKHTGWNYGG
jgi:flavin reductase (DIM6/NTAB) family NADH-FMN oxidoreductase RutF